MLPIDVAELSKAMLTAILTIFGGVIVFATGQFIEKFFVAPLDRFRRTLGDLAFNMIYFANIYTNPSNNVDETRLALLHKLRNLAARLISDSYAINGYWVLSLFKFIPPRKQVNEAANKLIMLSNSISDGDVLAIDQWRKDISSLLRLRIFGD